MGGPPAAGPWEGGKQPWAFLHRPLLLLWHQGGGSVLWKGKSRGEPAGRKEVGSWLPEPPWFLCREGWAARLDVLVD